MHARIEAHAVIAETTGQAPRRYRPPYGIFNATALALARAHRWELLLWSKDGRDWQRRATADSIAAHSTAVYANGATVDFALLPEKALEETTDEERHRVANFIGTMTSWPWVGASSYCATRD